MLAGFTVSKNSNTLDELVEKFKASLRSVEVPKEFLGLAGEYAVASELCKRGIYAQPTLGRHKATDLLAETEVGMLRIQVKTKFGKVWPNCKGVSGQNIALFFVDFENKADSERPDFYILTPKDWKDLVTETLRRDISRGAAVIDDTNTPVWVKQTTKSGRSYKGMSVKVSQISAYKERWDKVADMVQKG